MMKQKQHKDRFSNICGACEAARALSMSSYSPYSNLTQEEYAAKTTAGKLITDLGGVSGLFGIAANVAGTIQANRNAQSSTSNTDAAAQIEAIRLAAERKAAADAAAAEAERKKQQTNMIIIIVVAVVVVLGVVLFMGKGKKETTLAQ